MSTTTEEIAELLKRRQLVERYGQFEQRADLACFVSLNPRYREMVSFLRGALRQAKKRSTKHGREIGLGIEHLMVMLLLQNDRCAISGVKFSLAKVGSSNVRPFAPSIDRIDSRAGYVIGNVRLVCHCVNLMMNEWGDGVFHELVKRMKK